MSINNEWSDMVPAFLAKLWRLVNDPNTDDLISWNKDGLSFIIKDQSIFARELLPKNFKHNNMASMVRQLNKYGFHKRIGDSTSAKSTSKVEYRHPKFQRDHPSLLKAIKYKLPFPKNLEAKAGLEPEAIMNAMKAVRSLRRMSSSRFLAIRRHNQNLWTNVTSLRNNLQHQQKLINHILRSIKSTPTTSNESSSSTQLVNKDTPIHLMKLKSPKKKPEWIDSPPIKIEYHEENEIFNDFKNQVNNEAESNASILNEESNSFWEFQNVHASYAPSDEEDNAIDPLLSKNLETPITSSKITKPNRFESKELINYYSDSSSQMVDDLAQKAIKDVKVKKSVNPKNYRTNSLKKFIIKNGNATFQGLPIGEILKMTPSEQQKLFHQMRSKKLEQEHQP